MRILLPLLVTRASGRLTSSLGTKSNFPGNIFGKYTIHCHLLLSISEQDVFETSLMSTCVNSCVVLAKEK